MNPTAIWSRLNAALTPRSPADWRRFVVLAVILAAAYLLVGSLLSLLPGDGLDLLGAQSAILLYVLIGSAWWRLYVQAAEVDADGDGPAQRRLRRWLVRGAIVWVLLAYVVLLVAAISYADGDSSENRGDDNASWPLVVIFYLLPVALAAGTAGIGRATFTVRPNDRNRI